MTNDMTAADWEELLNKFCEEQPVVDGIKTFVNLLVDLAQRGSAAILARKRFYLGKRQINGGMRFEFSIYDEPKIPIVDKSGNGGLTAEEHREILPL